jgi:acyl carrier protein
MTPNRTLEQITAIMADVFDVDLGDGGITADTTAEDIEEWDSLSHIRLMVAVERKFNVKFKNSEIEALKRVGDLVTLVEAKASQSQSRNAPGPV